MGRKKRPKPPVEEKKDDLKVPNVEDILAELYAQMNQKMNFPNVDEAELKEKCKLAKITLSESKEKLAKTLVCIDSSQSKIEFLRTKFDEMREKTGREADTNKRHILEELRRERKEESKLMAKSILRHGG